jgi:aspartate ammonia-lyase
MPTIEFKHSGIENFQISGVTNLSDYVKAYAMVKLAAARANTEVGRMKKDRMDAIEKACQAVIDGKYHDQFLTDMYQVGRNICQHEC